MVIEDLCKECGITVLRKNYVRHLLTHTEEKFRCHICDKLFNTKNTLSQHENIHRMPKDLQCTQCQHILHSKDALNKHIQRIHERVKYSCPYCQKEFTGESYCANHIQHCRLAIPEKCMKCNKSFKGSSQIQKKGNFINLGGEYDHLFLLFFTIENDQEALKHKINT